MINLDTLKHARFIFENALFERGYGAGSLAERLDDRELLLTGRVVAAETGQRMIQITIDEDVKTCAFLKSVGVHDENLLLHIILSADDLEMDKCLSLFDEWILKDAPESRVRELAARVGRHE